MRHFPFFEYCYPVFTKSQKFLRYISENGNFVTECRLFNKNVCLSVLRRLKSSKFLKVLESAFCNLSYGKIFCKEQRNIVAKKTKFKVHSHLFFTLYEHLLVILLGVYENLSGLEVLIRRPGVNIPSRDVRNIYWNSFKKTWVINSAKGRAANKK